MVKVSTRPQEVFTLTLTIGAKPTRGQRLITVAQSTKCCALYETASKKHEADGKNDSERRRRQSTTSLLASRQWSTKFSHEMNDNPVHELDVLKLFSFSSSSMDS